MALNFPDSPNDGDTTAQSNGVTYIWRAAKTRWDVLYTPGSIGEFDAKLAGYEDTGLHVAYVGDLNDLVTNSQYRYQATGSPSEPSDLSTNDWVFIESIRFGIVDGTQLIKGLAASGQYKIWMRNQQGGTWAAWKLVVDNGAFPQRLAGYEDNGLLIAYLADLNDLPANSTYNINSSTVTNAPADMSDASSSLITTYPLSATAKVQVIYGRAVNGYKQWMRSEAGGTWDAWKLVVNGAAPFVGSVLANGTLISSNGGISVARTANGDYNLTFDDAQANSDYGVEVTVKSTTAAFGTSGTANSTTVARIITWEAAGGTPSDRAFTYSITPL